MSEQQEFQVDLGQLELTRSMKVQILSFDKEKDAFHLHLKTTDMKVRVKRVSGNVTDELGLEGKHATLSPDGKFYLNVSEEPVKRTSGCVTFNGKNL